MTLRRVVALYTGGPLEKHLQNTQSAAEAPEGCRSLLEEGG